MQLLNHRKQLAGKMKNNNLGELRHKLKGGETETHHIVNLISLIIILKVPIMWSRLEPYRSSIILLVALVIGGLLGIYAPSFASKLQPIGQIFLNLLFMIIVPLVGISVMSSITSMTDLKRLGRIMAIIFIVSIAMAFIPAAGIVALALWYNPAQGVTIDLAVGAGGQRQDGFCQHDHHQRLYWAVL